MDIRPDDLAELTESDIAALGARDAWIDQARPKQIPQDGDWTQLIWKAGRGFGKTLSVVEWLWWEGWRTGQPLILHAVSPTLGDVKSVMMEGVTGFQSVVPAECLYRGSWHHAYVETPQPTLTLANDTVIRGYGAQDQGARLRGPQCMAAGGDELREWNRPAGNLEQVHSNLMFGVRLPYPDGSPSRAVFSTTPKNIPYLRSLYKAPGVLTVTGTTYENLKNLNPAFRNTLLAKEGTKIGRTEIYAEDSEGDEDGIFKKPWIRLWPPFKKLPEFTHILMSMDTAFEEENVKGLKEGKEPDYSACSILGIFNVAQCFPTEAERKALRVKTKYAALLCDFWMERLDFPDLLEAARKAYRTKWGQPGRRPDTVLIENKASGISLRQTLMQYGVPTWPFNPRGQSKTMRAHTASPLVLQGMLFMPESSRSDRKGQVRDWADPLMDQMTTFSGEGSIEFDDGLDTITQAMIYLMEKGYFHAEPQGRAYPDMDEKEDLEQRQAVELAKRENRRNPYD